MKVGVLSDVHGNIVALESCLRYLEIEGVNQVISLGDNVGYLPHTKEVLSNLDSLNAKFLLGNHEAMALGIINYHSENENIYRLSSTISQLQDSWLDRMQSWLPYYELTINDTRILFVHGSPQNPLNGYLYPDSDLESLAKLPFDYVFMGHTHRPFIKEISNKKIINVGSCGLPRDYGSLASCVILDLQEDACEIIRIPFDKELVISKCKKEIHHSVIECLNRVTNQITGRIVKI